MSKQARVKMDAFHAKQRSLPLDSDGEQILPQVQPSEVLAPQTEMTEAEVSDAVHAAVARIDDAEKRAIGSKIASAQPPRSDPSIGRADLIRRAMALHKEKQGVLDELDDDAREKLAAMAMQAFQIGKPKT